MEIQPQEHPLSIGQIAYDPTDRWWQLLDHRGRRQNFLVLGELRPLEYVDDGQIVLAMQLFIADSPKAVDGSLRARCLAGDIELDHVLVHARAFTWGHPFSEIDFW